MSLSSLRSLVFGVVLAILLSCANPDTGQQANGINNVDRPITTPSPRLSIADENFAKKWKAEFNKLKSDIVVARDRWKQNKVNSYSFVAAKDVGGVSSAWNRSPVLIKVEDGQPISFDVVDKKNTSILARTDGFQEFHTIDKLFDYMLRELEAGRIVKADYDKHLAYPKFVSIAFSWSTHGARSIEVSKLTRANK